MSPDSNFKIYAFNATNQGIILPYKRVREFSGLPVFRYVLIIDTAELLPESAAFNT